MSLHSILGKERQGIRMLEGITSRRKMLGAAIGASIFMGVLMGSVDVYLQTKRINEIYAGIGGDTTRNISFSDKINYIRNTPEYRTNVVYQKALERIK